MFKRPLQFDEIMRLLLLCAGIVFFGVGIWMIKGGIAAEGSIDIRSTMLSGSLKTGSAGLFITLFAFFMIVLATLPLARPLRLPQSQPASDGAKVEDWRTARKIWFGFSAAAATFYLLFRYCANSAGEETLFELLAGGNFLIACVFAYMTFVSRFISKS